MNINICPHCNALRDPNGKFCPECGKEISSYGNTETNANSDPGSTSAPGTGMDGKIQETLVPKDTSPPFWNLKNKLLASAVLGMPILAIVVIMLWFAMKVDVYVAGYEENEQGDRVAILWKNGIPQSFYGNCEAYDVYVANQDVYVCGTVYSGPETAPSSKQAPTLWINGIAKRLDEPVEVYHYSTYLAASVFVLGKDVYAAGSYAGDARQHPYLWKNGISQRLSKEGHYGWANSVFVSNNDVYVTGCELSEKTHLGGATLWKNGVAQRLVGEGSSASSVCVSGGDVYVAGYTGSARDSMGRDRSRDRAVLWKNGTPQFLAYGNNQTYATSVFVVDNDVYVAGYENVYISGDEDDIHGETPIYISNALLWKNGIAQPLGDKSVSSMALSVFVSRGNVYAAGVVWDGRTTEGHHVATLWKNGNPQNLGKGKWASSVFVKEQWYRLAAEQGHRGAVRATDKLSKPYISLTGEWSYDGYPHDSLYLTLHQSGNRIRGTHVAIALGGNRIDAYLDDEESINGTINGDMARVNFKSAYFDGGGGVAIIKILDEKTIEWTVIEEREHWFPKSAILTKDK